MEIVPGNRVRVIQEVWSYYDDIPVLESTKGSIARVLTYDKFIEHHPEMKPSLVSEANIGNLGLDVPQDLEKWMKRGAKYAIQYESVEPSADGKHHISIGDIVLIDGTLVELVN